MGSDIRCFLLVPTEESEISLRRWSNVPCKAMGYHQCSTAKSVGDPMPLTADHDERFNTVDVDKDDKRWPVKCAGCDYVFTPKDYRAVVCSRLYTRSDTGTRVTLADAPPGAMWYADWAVEFGYRKGPDGHVLVLRTPGGDWHIDGTDDRPGWERRGPAPYVSAKPSILIRGAGTEFHGWLTDGMLREV